MENNKQTENIDQPALDAESGTDWDSIVIKHAGNEFEVKFGYKPEANLPDVALISQTIKAEKGRETTVMHTIPIEEFIRESTIEFNKKEMKRVTKQVNRNNSSNNNQGK